MLIGPHLLRRHFGVTPRGVLHVGAHEAEEAPFYQELGWGPVVWVEMLPDRAEALRHRFAGDPGNQVIEAAAWSESGVVHEMHEASNGQSSSLFRPETHLVVHPEITFEQRSITTRRLDELLDPSMTAEFLNLDVQGAEMAVMEGLGARLHDFKWCYLEVNVDLLYKQIPLREEVDAFLADHGFTRIVEAIHTKLGWGDALYANGRLLPPTELFRQKLRGARWRGLDGDPLAPAGAELVDMLADAR